MHPHPTSLNLRVEFRNAVRTLSDHPDASNVDRYLAASRALDDGRVRPRRRRAA
jgi:hypothetical protein